MVLYKLTNNLLLLHGQYLWFLNEKTVFQLTDLHEFKKPGSKVVITWFIYGISGDLKLMSLFHRAENSADLISNMLAEYERIEYQLFLKILFAFTS